jgi:hypothetical protein
MVPAAGKELRCGVGSGAPWRLCGVRDRYVVKSACVRAAQSCLGCRSSRIHHGSIGSVCTHTTVARAAPTTSSKGTIQPSLGTPFRSEARWREEGVMRKAPHRATQSFRIRGQDREGARPRCPADAARPRRRGDRMIGRREFITLLGVTWPFASWAQTPAPSGPISSAAEGSTTRSISTADFRPKKIGRVGQRG